jgi:hypothetical protein
MSNKFANKLKVSLVALLAFSFVCLTAFQPSRQNFSSRYEYALYRSWQRKAAHLEMLSAQIKPEVVVQKFRTADSKLVEVQYDWEEQRIYGQKEVISLPFPANMQQHKVILENFLYRLNCAQKLFLQNMLQKTEFKVKYKQGGLDSLWSDFAETRFEIQTIKWQHSQDSLKFQLNSFSGQQLTIEFPISFQFSVYLDEWKEQTTKVVPEIETVTTTPQIPTTQETSPAKLPLVEFLYSTYQNQFRRELMNNKLTDIEHFLVTEFPKHRLTRQENNYYLENDAEFLGLGNFVAVQVKRNNDSWDIEASPYYNLIGEYLKLSSHDSLEIGLVDKAALKQVAGYFPQLLYMHRSLGTKLFNFLLIPDEVPTTLLIHNGKRQRLDFASYDDLLLRLHSYWKKREIFFSLQDIRQMNGFIEFKGMLAAVGKDKYDWAEIRFHLNKEYKIDLVMMSLHVDKKIER